MTNKGKLARAVAAQRMNLIAAIEPLEGRRLMTGTGLQPFTNGSGISPDAIALADFNNDGKLDYVMGNIDEANSNHSLTVGLGAGDGTFVPLASFAFSSKPTVLATGDFNGDGKTDLVAGGDSAAGASVFLGNGDGTFTAPTVVAAGRRIDYVETADLNEDGKLDLVVTDAISSISELLGNGDGTFGSPEILPAGYGPGTIKAGDLNGDGHTDLVVVDVYESIYSAEDTISVLIGRGDGTFELPALLAGGMKLSTLDLGDLNGDGFLDIIARSASYYDPNSINVMMGKGDGTFQAVAMTPLAAKGFGEVKVADVTADGIPDAVTLDYDTVSIVVLKGVGNGTFSTTRKFAVGNDVSEFPFDLALGDLNADGRLDAAAIVKADTDVNAGRVLTNIGDSYQYVLEFPTPPGANAVAGAASGPITISIKSISGQAVLDDPITITLTVTSMPAGGGAPMSTTFTADTVNGMVTFNGVALTKAGTYSFQAASPGASNPITTGIAVSPAAAAQLAFVANPTSTTAGGNLGTVQVAVIDSFGNIVTPNTSTLELFIQGQGITGATMVQAQNGVATFANLSITKAGTYQLAARTSAAGALPNGTSSSFTVSAAAATYFGFLTQPVNVIAGSPFSITATAFDEFANRVVSSSPIDQATLSGTTGFVAGNSPTFADGVVTFTGVTVRTAGTATLMVGNGGLTAGTTAFVVSPGAAAKLAFVQTPAGGPAGSVLPEVTVAVQDAFSNVIATDTSTVTLSLTSATATGTAGGTTVVNALLGQARFTTLSISAPGTYQLVVTSGAFTATSAEFVVGSPADAVAPTVVVAPVLPPTTASPRFSFTVIYSDNLGIDQSSISADNFTLSSATAGVSLKFTPQIQSDFTDKRVRVIYTLDAPSGGFLPAADYVLASLDLARDAAGNPSGAYLNNFAITRAAPGGSNPNFGGGTGQVVTPNTEVQFLIQDSFQSVATDPIFSVGFAIDSGHAGQIVVVRQNPDGSNDTSFDGDGVKSFTLPDATLAARAVNFDRDGTILVVAQRDGLGAYLLVRLNTDGAQVGEVIDISEAPAEDITVVRTSADGKRLLIGGRSGNNLVLTSLLATGKSAGNLDRSFGTAGQFIQPVGDDDDAAVSDITVSKTGDIFVGSVKNNQPQVVKLSSKGKGAVAVVVSLSDVAAFASVDRVVVDPLGRVVFTVATANSADDAARGATGAAVVRLAFDKKKQLLLDPTFEGDGRVLVDQTSSPTSQGTVRVKLESITLLTINLRSAGKTGVTAPAGGNIYNLARSSADGSQTEGLSLVADAGDLTPQTLKVTGKKPIKAGSVINAAVKISNVGTLTTAGQFAATLILTNSATGAIFTLQATGTLSAVKPGASSTVSPILFTLPTDLAAGTYQVNIQVDGSTGGASDFVPGSTLKKPVTLKTV